jgi:hypothetical protein
MKPNTIKVIFWSLIVLIGLWGLRLQAQDHSTAQPSGQVEEKIIVHKGVAHSTDAFFLGEPPTILPFGGTQATFEYIGSEFEPIGEVVKGAPYSAEAVSKTVQTLSDGNRIVRESTTGLYRDGEGRTRREQNLSHLGGMNTETEPIQIIFIHDPAAGIDYILHPNDKTAEKITMRVSHTKSIEGKPEENIELKVETTSTSGGTHQVRQIQRIIEHQETSIADNAKKEPLGTQMIEGLKAEGTRVTTTLPAGQIGNEQPISIVSESWFSPELKTVVMSRHTDPRMGETTYRLTNLKREEPPKSLFEPPADYKIESGKGNVLIHKREVKE